MKYKKYRKYFPFVCIVIVLLYWRLKHISGSNQTDAIGKAQLDDVELGDVEIYELLAWFSLNESPTHAAVEFFKQKYSNKTVVITDPHVEAKYIPIYDNADGIFILHFETALKVLKMFGHLISSLRVEYSESYSAQNDPSEINKFINLYCSESLTQLTVDSYDLNLFGGMTKPFGKVEILHLGGQFNTLSSSDLSFAELFPMVHHLRLQHIQITDNEYIDQELVHLKQLYVQLCYDNETTHFCSNENSVEKLLGKNPQIQALSLVYCSPKFLTKVYSILPNITDLTLVSYDPRRKSMEGILEDDIIFEFVTNFTLITAMGEMPLNVFFKNLKELHVESTLEWFILAERNQNLEKLSMNGGYVDNGQFMRIVSTNFKLIETTLYIGESVWNENIINFMTNSTHLRRAVFFTENSDLFRNKMWLDIEDDWQITGYAAATVLERKFPNSDQDFMSNYLGLTIF